jgi:hypothetical protein
MVARPSASPRVAFVGAESRRRNVSAGSTVRSPFTSTETVRAVVPAAKSTPPLAAW